MNRKSRRKPRPMSDEDVRFAVEECWWDVQRIERRLRRLAARAPKTPEHEPETVGGVLGDLARCLTREPRTPLVMLVEILEKAAHLRQSDVDEHSTPPPAVAVDDEGLPVY